MTNSDGNAEGQSTAAVAFLSSPSPPQRVSRRVATSAPINSNGTSHVPGNTPSLSLPLAAVPPLSGGAVVQQIASDSSKVPKAGIVVARPPLNAYLKISVIRDNNDAVVCEDPEHPGRKKRIFMNQLSSLEACSNKDGNVFSTTPTSSNAASDAAAAYVKMNKKNEVEKQQHQQQQQKQEKNANKKEIPVPTITTVKGYDRDVPPNFSIPESYVRNICPTYAEVEEAVEYNVDAEDEYWWKENRQFGPFAKAKILIGGKDVIEDDDDENENQPSSINDGFVVDNANNKVVSDATKSEEGTSSTSRSRSNERYGRKKMRKPSVKSSKSSSSSSSCMIIPDNSMEIDRTNSDVSAPLPPPAPSFAATSATSHPHTQSMTIEEVLLLNPKYLYSHHSTRSLLQKFNPKLPLPLFEKMIDILEKATGFESIMTNSQAEQILISKLPQLVDIFGPLSAKERQREEEMEEQYLSRWLKNNKHSTTGKSPSSQCYPTLASPVTLPTVIHQVYNYWVGKRSKLKKPLLRRYWPPTLASDPNPHQVFRQRDKEKRRLRKKRQNDMEAYKKMKQLKLDFERLGVLCELILKREEVNRNLVELTNEYFEERWHAWTDTTGVPRRHQNANYHGANIAMLESIVHSVPKYFEDGPIVRFRGSKKRQRPVVQNNNVGGGWSSDAREPSPIPPNSVVTMGGALPPFPNNSAMLSTSSANTTNLIYPLGINSNPVLPGGVAPPPPPPPRNIVVAGHDGGYPAPNFLQPLASRDSHPITNWDDAVPSIPSYVNGHLTTQTDKFRHRPRLGRGGRIIIDRVPIQAYISSSSSKEGLGQNSSISTPPPAPTVVIYGSPMKRSGYDIGTLGADGPNYSVHANPDSNNMYDAKSAPKAPPAKCLADLLPKSLGDKIVLSRRIEEICALGLMEDYQNQHGSRIGGSITDATAGEAVSVSVTSTSSNGNSASSSAAVAGASASAALSEEMDEILVPIEDWMEAPEALNLYGSEQFVIGPL